MNRDQTIYDVQDEHSLILSKSVGNCSATIDICTPGPSNSAPILPREDSMELIFNTSLSIEEIEKNFEDVDVFENLMVALGEALLMEEQRKKEGQ